MNTITTRARDLRGALSLEIFTIAYMIFEAVAALGIGFATRSVSLETFGVDSLIEIASALALLWRLRAEQRGEDDARVEQIEWRAARFVGVSLLALAAYVLVQSIIGLSTRAQPETNVWGILLAVSSLIVMPLLARLKLRAADRIGSRALHADAYETVACAYLSLTLLVGLAANYFFGWWWADSVAALIMIPIIVKEGLEALRGETCDDCHG